MGVVNVAGSSEGGATVEAIITEDGRMGRMAFTEIRQRDAIINGRHVRLFCSNDGIGEIVAYLDGKFYATGGGNIQSWLDEGHFWIVVKGTSKAPLNAKRSSKAEWFRNNWFAMSDNVETMCPAAWGGPVNGAMQRVIDAMKRGNENYRRNANRLGIKP